MTTSVEVIASVYLIGAQFCISDDAELGMLATAEQSALIHKHNLVEQVGRHRDEIRQAVFNGIGQVLDGYLPALDGLDRTEVQA